MQVVTIDTEARQNKNLIIDIDKWRERLVTTNKLLTFPNPSIYTIEKNYYYLLRNSVVKEFESKYKMKPSYLSKDEYGTLVLDKLLMYINDCFCLEDFNFSTVIIPTFEAITFICQDKVEEKKASDLDSIDW